MLRYLQNVLNDEFMLSNRGPLCGNLVTSSVGMYHVWCAKSHQQNGGKGPRYGGCVSGLEVVAWTVKSQSPRLQVFTSRGVCWWGGAGYNYDMVSFSALPYHTQIIQVLISYHFHYQTGIMEIKCL